MLNILSLLAISNSLLDISKVLFFSRIVDEDGRRAEIRGDGVMKNRREYKTDPC